MIAAYQQRGSRKALMQIAREFVAIHQLRYARLSPTLVVFEQYNEINEDKPLLTNVSLCGRNKGTRRRL